MTNDEATEIAKRIINTWHGGPRLDEWIDALGPLDVGTAGTAFIRLRNELEHAPKIATFIAKYRTLNTAATAPQPTASACICQGTGWMEATHGQAHQPSACNGEPAAGTCHCHAVIPCRCTASHQAHVIVDLIHRDRPYLPPARKDIA